VKFLRKIKPSRVLGNPKIDRRPATHGALLRAELVEVRSGAEPLVEEHHILYATNGYCLVRIDLGVPVHGDVPGPIPAVALRHMEKGVNAALLEREVRVGSITRYERVYSESNPGSQTDFPDVDELEAKAPDPGDRKLTFTFSPAFLSDIAAAMAAGHGVTLSFDADKFKDYEVGDGKWYEGAVRITPHQPERVESATGVLMPIRPIGA
jgi:hypothetical protein